MPLAASMARLLEQLRRRWQLLRLIEAGLYALAIAIAGYMFAALLLPPGDPGRALLVVVASGLLGFAGLVFLLTAWAPTPVRLAMAADRHYGLAEKLATAIEVRPGQASAVGAALLVDAEQAAQRADPKEVAPWFASRLRWAMAAPVVALLLALAAFGLGAGSGADEAGSPPVEAERPVSAGDIAAAAELIAADAQTRDDPELAEVAAEMRALADRLEAADIDEGERGELAELLDRAGNRYGNPLHDWPPFEGDQSGLADRMEAARLREGQDGPANPPGAAGGAGAPGAPGGETAAGEPEAGEIKPSDLPGGGEEGQGLGIAPPTNAQQSSAMGEETGLDDATPQTAAQGAAEGAGEAESNMAGTGEGPAANAGAPSLPPPLGFAETQTLAAQTTLDAERVRSSESTEARRTVVEDRAISRQWPRQDAMPVERQPVPPSAAPAVTRLFSRDETGAR